MNYWIADFRAELLKTIAEWDFLLINDSEARMLSGENNLRKAAAKIIGMGPSILVIKRGEHGAILWHGDKHFMVPGYFAGRRLRSHWSRRLFPLADSWALLRARASDLQAKAWTRTNCAARCNLRFRYGQLLLRAFWRGAVPHADPAGESMPGFAEFKEFTSFFRCDLAGVNWPAAHLWILEVVTR